MPWLTFRYRLVATALLLAASPAVRAQQDTPAGTAPVAQVTLGPVDPARGAALVERAVDALGGAAVVDGARRLEIRGHSTRFMATGAEMQVETASFSVPPDRYRQESKLAASTIATVLNPEGAFLLVGGQGVAMPSADAAALRGTARRNLVTLLQGRRQKGYEATWIGSAVLPQGPAQLVNVGGKNDPTTLYIDEKSGRILRISYGSPVAGQVQELVIDYSNYRPAGGGLVYPFSSAGFIADKPAFRGTLTSILLNGTIDESLFATPAAPPAPPAAVSMPAPGAH
jgi:hypothetical protein